MVGKIRGGRKQQLCCKCNSGSRNPLLTARKVPLHQPPCGLALGWPRCHFQTLAGGCGGINQTSWGLWWSQRGTTERNDPRGARTCSRCTARKILASATLPKTLFLPAQLRTAETEGGHGVKVRCFSALMSSPPPRPISEITAAFPFDDVLLSSTTALCSTD